MALCIFRLEKPKIAPPVHNEFKKKNMLLRRFEPETTESNSNYFQFHRFQYYIVEISLNSMDRVRTSPITNFFYVTNLMNAALLVCSFPLALSFEIIWLYFCWCFKLNIGQSDSRIHPWPIKRPELTWFLVIFLCIRS